MSAEIGSTGVRVGDGVGTSELLSPLPWPRPPRPPSFTLGTALGHGVGTALGTELGTAVGSGLGRALIVGPGVGTLLISPPTKQK